MNTHFLRSKKASPTILLVVVTALSLALVQPDIASGQILAQGSTRSMPQSAQRYMNKGAGENKGEGTPLKIEKKTETDLLLMQPLDDSTKSLDAKPGIQIFFDYFNLSWPWVLGVCAGLAVLQAMIGGMQLMLDGQRESGKDRMLWAIAGLLIIALSGMILTTINPIFYS